MTDSEAIADKILPPAPRPFSERLKAAVGAPVKAMRRLRHPWLIRFQYVTMPAGYLSVWGLNSIQNLPGKEITEYSGSS